MCPSRATDPATATTREVYLGLGSNLGDRGQNLRRGLELLGRGPLRVRRVSSVYESAAVGPVTAQPDFYNLVARVQTELTPLQLLRHSLEVERLLGRPAVRPVDKGPRVLDVDLLLSGARVRCWGEELVLPHPELTRRAFVVLPLLELRPDLVDPRDGRPLGRLAPELRAAQVIARLGDLRDL